MALPQIGERAQSPSRKRPPKGRKAIPVSKLVQSKIERYPGSITLADPLNIRQAMLVEAGMQRPKEDEVGEDGKVWLSVVDEKRLPAICACVEKWELENFPNDVTPETFPASPRLDTAKLIEWLFYEIRLVYFGDLSVPNA